MSTTGQGIISPNELMKKLVSSKKVMDKVETGTYEKGYVDENILRKAPEELDMSLLPQQIVSAPITKPVSSDGLPDIDRINKTKLPDAIKRAMIENPIQQISLSDNTINMDILKGAKRLMEQEGMISKQPKPQPQQQPTRQPVNTYTPQPSSSSIDMNALAVLIENTVRKVMDEKLTQLLSAHQTTTVNESLVLKVGDSIFKGKITGVNKAK